MDEALTAEQREFLEHHHNAVMTTVDPAGRPHAVPVLCALVGGELWSSGTERRARTRHLASAPVASLTVLPAGFWGRWLTVTGPVTVRRADRVGDNLRLYRAITGKVPDDVAEYGHAMLDEQRLVYAITPERAYPLAPPEG